jgi:hypothetical protein
MVMDYRNIRPDHSLRSTIALYVAVAALGGMATLSGAFLVHLEEHRRAEKRFRDQHEELVEMRTRIDRLDGVMDRALDAAAIARAVVEESKDE